MFSSKCCRLSTVIKIHKNLYSKTSTDLMELGAQRFLYPVQSRWSDNDGNGHINNGVYVAWASMLLCKYSARYTNLKEISVYTAEIDAHHRKSVSYPDLILGGVNVTKVGRSSVVFDVSFFKPKPVRVRYDLTDLGVPPNGKFADNVMTEVSDHYQTGSAALIRMVSVFMDNRTKQPVADLPSELKCGLNKILVS